MRKRQPMTASQRALAEKNVQLVGHVVRNLGLKSNLEDAFGAGCVGLCLAAVSWREGMSPFSTYACHIIRHEILSFLKSENAVKKNTVLLDSEMPDARDDFRRLETSLFIEGFLGSEKASGEAGAKIIVLLLKGYRAGEISKILGVSLSKVYRARRRLIEAIRQSVF